MAVTGGAGSRRCRLWSVAWLIRSTCGRCGARSGRLGPRSGDLAASPFRVDRDRIVASPFFARLGGVTQVVSASGSGLLHNRLTHSLKVAQVARAIAERLLADPELAPLLDKLGGCDPDVVEAAGAGARPRPPAVRAPRRAGARPARPAPVRAARTGSRATRRACGSSPPPTPAGPAAVGLDLTAAVRAAMLKYPWTRLSHPDPHPRHLPSPPRGASEPPDEPGTGSSKFSVYVTELDDMAQARAPFAGRLASWQQTVEASVMDTADDIAYAIHDLEDFHRIGVLQHAPVAAELGHWLSNALELAALDDATLAAQSRRPGYSLEQLRRRMHRRDAWIVDDDAFVAAVSRVRAELVDGLLDTPFDGSVEAEQAVGAVLVGVDGAARRRHGRGDGPADPLRARAARAGPVARGAGAQVRAPPVRAAAAGSRAAPTRSGRAAHLAGRGARAVARPTGTRRTGCRAGCRTSSSWPRPSTARSPRPICPLWSARSVKRPTANPESGNWQGDAR